MNYSGPQPKKASNVENPKYVGPEDKSNGKRIHYDDTNRGIRIVEMMKRVRQGVEVLMK